MPWYLSNGPRKLVRQKNAVPFFSAMQASEQGGWGSIDVGGGRLNESAGALYFKMDSKS